MKLNSRSVPFVSVLLAAAVTAYGVSVPSESEVTSIHSKHVSDKLVFCHFMVGIVSDRRSSTDYDSDMLRAKSLGIDAFALNIGTDSFTDTQLGYAYESAANNGMSVFISFDFNWWNPSTDATTIGQTIAQYANQTAQLKVGGAVFVSSFSGDGLDVVEMRLAAGVDLFFAPNFHPGQSNFSQIDGALNWLAWPNNGNNKAPEGSDVVTVREGDLSYESALAGESYIAPASAWFSTHYGPEVSYSKNWIFPSDLLFYERWQEILRLQPQYVEIITWNDYGESHYIGPLSSPHYDDGNSKWTNDMPHDGWLDLAKPFIAAYKSGSTDVSSHITEDKIIYWYRVAPKDLDCDSTDTTMVSANNASGNYFEGRPNGWQTVTDSVFVVPLLTAPGTVYVNSNGTVYELHAPAGASAFALDMVIGVQSFELVRRGRSIISATSLRPIAEECPCGIYNFNAYVGTVPAPTTVDSLQPDGLGLLQNGLKVSCDPTPSFTTTPIATGVPTTTITATMAVTPPARPLPFGEWPWER